MNPRRLLTLFALAALVLVACTPTRSVYPPAISVQALHVLKDGRWQVTVRFDNYAYRALRFDTLDAELSIGGGQFPDHRPGAVVAAVVDIDHPRRQIQRIEHGG